MLKSMMIIKRRAAYMVFCTISLLIRVFASYLYPLLFSNHDAIGILCSTKGSTGKPELVHKGAVVKPKGMYKGRRDDFGAAYHSLECHDEELSLLSVHWRARAVGY